MEIIEESYLISNMDDVDDKNSAEIRKRKRKNNEQL